VSKVVIAWASVLSGVFVAVPVLVAAIVDALVHCLCVSIHEPVWGGKK
jgi:hypothetical protein